MPGFSADLRARLLLALEQYLSSDDVSPTNHFETLAKELCTESHERRYSMETMLLELHQLFGELPRHLGDQLLRDEAYDRLIEACAKVFPSTRMNVGNLASG